jgi:sigma-B regulation protein RsbU (phosphoserine phosphatase)
MGLSIVKILIGEDDPISRRMLQATLVKWGCEVVVCKDGSEAWVKLQSHEAPRMAILDWMMPGMDGVQVCRNLRKLTQAPRTYIILLTAKGRSQDVVAGLAAGADDYVTKPFDRDELHARVQAGFRTIELETSLADRVRELEQALLQVRQLQGLLPICAYCKRIRKDEDYWQQIEGFVAEHSGAQFSHSICPGCYEKIVKPELEELCPSGELRSSI